MKPIILASNSPRRTEILRIAGIEHRVIPSTIEEKIDPAKSPIETALSLAKQKAKDIYMKYPDSIVIGADTLVIIDTMVLGKPIDRSDAYRMLKLLSGKTHQVVTAYCIITKEREYQGYSQTDVTFGKLSDDEIAVYLDTGDPYDKAGAYGIQGFASKYIKRIEGDYFNVVGLPIYDIYQVIKNFIND